MSRTPTVFVSSTYYDLKQLRRDLQEFIEGYGFESLLSEYDSFPVAPEVSAVENCLRVVDARADMFVLVVGGRRGSVDDSTGKSITNLELIKARGKRIPIFVFVEQAVLNVMKVWEQSPDSDFSAVVDSPQLFDFVSSLRDSGAMWVRGFGHAQDIVSALRRQWSYLFYEGLDLRRKLTPLNVPQSLQRLEPEALKLVLERPRAWEFRLFAAVLKTELARRSVARRDLELGLAIRPVRSLDQDASVAWIQDQLASIKRIASALEPVVDTLTEAAFGKPGKSGDPETIVYLASKLGDIYGAALEWALNHKSVEVTDTFKHLVELQQEFPVPWIKRAEAIADNLPGQIEDALAYADARDKPLEVPTVLELDFSWHDPTTPEYHNEMARLQQEFGV